MVRGQAQRVTVVLLGLLVFISVLAGSFKVNAARKPSPEDVENIVMSHLLAEQYGLTPEDLTPLRQAGMKWNEIRDYLEQLYPRPKEIRLTTKDYVDLAQRTGITPVEAIKVYEFALRYRLYPAWLASLKKEAGSWEKITAALQRFWQAQSKLAEEASRTFQSPRAVAPRVFAAIYGVPVVDVEQQVKSGIEPRVLLDLLFLADLRGNVQQLVSVPPPERWQGKDKQPPVRALHQAWTMRKFPSRLLPLKLPPGWRAEPLEPMSLAGTSVLPGMPPFQLGSDSGWAQSAWGSETGVGTSAIGGQNTVAPMSSPTPAPSIQDPGALYGTGRVSPFKAYFEGSSERIDPASGALIIRQTDFVLPGRNGMDLTFTRVYNSQKANMELPRVEYEATFCGYYFYGGHYFDEGPSGWYWETSTIITEYWWWYEYSYGAQFSPDGSVEGEVYVHYSWYSYDSVSGASLDSGSETYGPYYGPVSPAPDDPGVPQYTYSITGSTSPDTYLDRLYGLGVGWSLDFPSVEFTDNSMYLHYQGSIYKLTPGTGGSYTLDHYAIGDLKFQSDTNYAGASYSLRRKDGMIWYFRSDGRLLVIQNQFGNTIRFEYDSSNRIARIFDTVNWKVEFNYNAPLPTGRSLSFIPQSVVSVSVYASPSAEIPEFTWYYALGPTSHPDKTKLAAVIPPEPQTPITEYLYTKCQTSFIPYVEGYGTGPSINYYYLTLDTIVHPSGGMPYRLAQKPLDWREMPG